MKHVLPSTSASPRPSACPGLSRIVPAQDGGICRIKLPCGRLTSVQAHAVAEAATAHANGVIETTNRANLQIRGVRPGAEAALVDQLLAADLGPSTPGADDVRNLMVSPAAGLDPAAVVDISSLADDLLALLQNSPRFHALSPKFALLLDGGEQLAMLEHPHDIWLSVMVGGPTPQIAFGLAGCPPQRADEPDALAAVRICQTPQLVEALLDLFLELATPEQTRMRHLLKAHPAGDLLMRLQARLDFPLLPAGHWRRPSPPAGLHIGTQPQRQAGLRMVGGVPAVGRLTAEQLARLADLAETRGDASLRLTPWQSVLLPNVPEQAISLVLQQLEDLGLAIDARSPLAWLIACTGSTGCAKGLADTKGDALWLASHLGPLPGLHLSGCPRSCAAAHVAPLTLLAVGPGRYDLYQRETGDNGFGRLLTRNLTIQEAAERLASSPDTWSPTHA
ncbi:precorrin-3B synthase [Metapseudomonas boanensis]|uniref:Precorrin-3B synthase n=1 Tax=Metapseudomonas boanensis TaxID=2822138 RepID=A0ABS5XJU8_9GAMM|nr:precorrin-3B synthase [Pseudomonas boanensis]